MENMNTTVEKKVWTGNLQKNSNDYQVYEMTLHPTNSQRDANWNLVRVWSKRGEKDKIQCLWECREKVILMYFLEEHRWCCFSKR